MSINMTLKHRHPIRKKIADGIIKQVEEEMGCNVVHGNIVESAEFNGIKLLLIDGSPDIIFLNDSPFLTLHGIKKYKPMRRFATVDRGAVKFVLSGANVMAPGITEADENIRKGDAVWVRNEERTAMALGYALMGGKEMVEKKKGVAIESIHHIGDELWELATNL